MLPDSDFDRESFVTGSQSKYINPRTGYYNGTTNPNDYWMYAHPIKGEFHWADLLINMPGLNLFLFDKI